jgi:hypothetical protein
MGASFFIHKTVWYNRHTMQKIIIVGAVAVVLVVAGYFLLRDRTGEDVGVNQPEGEFTVDGETWTRVSDTEVGIQFAYRTNPNGYELTTTKENETGDGDFLKRFVLMEKAEAAALATSTAPREFPPTISIAVFRNADNMFPGQWAAEHPEHSNIDLALTELGSNPVAGAQAVQYRADGLYTTEYMIIAHGGLVFVLRGEFIDEASQIRRDFDAFVDSIEFIRAEGQE